MGHLECTTTCARYSRARYVPLGPARARLLAPPEGSPDRKRATIPFRRPLARTTVSARHSWSSPLVATTARELSRGRRHVRRLRVGALPRRLGPRRSRRRLQKGGSAAPPYYRPRREAWSKRGSALGRKAKSGAGEPARKGGSASSFPRSQPVDGPSSRRPVPWSSRATRSSFRTRERPRTDRSRLDTSALWCAPCASPELARVHAISRPALVARLLAVEILSTATACAPPRPRRRAPTLRTCLREPLSLGPAPAHPLDAVAAARASSPRRPRSAPASRAALTYVHRALAFDGTECASRRRRPRPGRRPGGAGGSTRSPARDRRPVVAEKHHPRQRIGLSKAARLAGAGSAGTRRRRGRPRAAPLTRSRLRGPLSSTWNGRRGSRRRRPRDRRAIAWMRVAPAREVAIPLRRERRSISRTRPCPPRPHRLATSTSARGPITIEDIYRVQGTPLRSAMVAVVHAAPDARSRLHDGARSRVAPVPLGRPPRAGRRRARSRSADRRERADHQHHRRARRPERLLAAGAGGGIPRRARLRDRRRPGADAARRARADEIRRGRHQARRERRRLLPRRQAGGAAVHARRAEGRGRKKPISRERKRWRLTPTARRGSRTP